MNRYLLCAVAALICLCVACGSPESLSPTSPSTPSPSPAPTPTPAPAPAPVATTLSGVVTITPGGARATGATIVILDGANAGRTTTTDGTGSYALTGLTPSNGNVAARAAGYTEDRKGLFISGASTLNFVLSAPLFSRSGSGNDVFDMPTYVARVRIRGTYTGSSSNFIVRIGGRLVVNELIGTSWTSTVTEGVYVTTGGVVEITNSSGVTWVFTEVR